MNPLFPSHFFRHCVPLRTLLPLTCFFLLLCACTTQDSPQKAESSPPAPVTVAKVQQKDMPRQITVPGTVEASASVDVRSRVNGEILEIYFTEGEEVKAGQKLLFIDPRPFDATLKEARANLEKIRAQLVKASRDTKRYGKLVSNGYVSRDAFEQASTSETALKADLNAAQAAVESATLERSYCLIKAPIKGRAGKLLVHKGNMLRTGESNAILTINTLEPVYISFAVPEKHLNAILELQRVQPLSVTATPVGGAQNKGAVNLIDNTVDSATGTIRLRAAFPNKDRTLWPGQFVQLTLTLGMDKDVLVLPVRTVTEGRDETFVYAINDGKAEYRKVNLLYKTDTEAVLDSGVSNNELVVVDGQMRLVPDAAVTIHKTLSLETDADASLKAPMER